MIRHTSYKLHSKHFLAYTLWKILHLTQNFYTTSGCDGCDKYEVCHYHHHPPNQHHQHLLIIILITSGISLECSGEVLLSTSHSETHALVPDHTHTHHRHHHQPGLHQHHHHHHHHENFLLFLEKLHIVVKIIISRY